MRKELSLYLPPILLQTQAFQLLCSVEDPELDALFACADEVLDAQFIHTAPEQAVERYEKIYKIVPKDTETLEERRFRVLSKINAQLPYTVRMLKRQLETLCGTDGYDVELDNSAYHLLVKVALTAKNNFQAVGDLLKQIVPANMDTVCMLKYNQHQTITRFTHSQLANYTNAQLREEVLP